MNKFLKIIGAVAVINVLARFFGFLREIVIGVQYGTTTMADGIIMAYTIPNFLYLVIGGAFTTAFISIYNKTKVPLADYISRTFTTILVTITLVTVVTVVLADPILRMFYKDVTQQEFELLKSLYFWMMPSTIMLVLSTWLSGILNVQGKFHLSSFSVLVYNISFLVVSVGLALVIGPIGYGIGALVGAIFMIGFLIYGVRNADNISWKLSLQFADDQKELWKIALPIMVGGATAQLYILIQRFFTGALEDGAVSAMNYATKVSQFPQAILMTAVTTVIYPLLSKKEGEGDQQSVKSLYVKGLRLLYLLIMPISVYVYFQAEVVVKIVFEYGNFNSESTMMTTPLLQLFSLTMFFLAANMYVTRFYYAKGNSITPVVFGIFTVFGVNIAVIYALIENYGAEAVAWGTLISAVVNFLLLVGYLQFKYQLFIVHRNGLQYLKLVVLTVGSVGLSFVVSQWLVFDQKWLHFVMTVIVSSLGYAVLLLALKFPELQAVVTKVLRKISK